MTAAVYTCPWCRCTGDAAAASCPRCGAPFDVATLTSDSGWSELPPVRDMARIQCGRSHCQIEGTYVPVVDFTLAPDDHVYFGHHELLWMEPSVGVAAMPMKGAWTRMRAGLPVVMTVATGPGRIAFSKDLPGEVIALPLDPGAAVEVREHVFLVATASVAYGYEESGVWFMTGSGNDTVMHYPLGRFVDRFAATGGPGLLILHAHGNAFVRTLAPGESICVKPTALLYKDPTVRMHLHLEYPRGTLQGFGTRLQNRYVWLTMEGPGRVAVQSAYEHFEDPREPITRFSGTRHAW
jgi:uncharacterized protein (AIM24 family)